MLSMCQKWTWKLLQFRSQLGLNRYNNAGVTETGDAYFQRIAGLRADLNTPHSVFLRVLSICGKRMSKFLQFRSHFGLNRYNSAGLTEKGDAYFQGIADVTYYLNTSHSVFPRVLSICEKRISKLVQFRSQLGLKRYNNAGVTETGDAYFRRMAGTIAYLNTPHFVFPRVLSICVKRILKLMQFRSHFGLNCYNNAGVTETDDAYFRRMAGTIAYLNTSYSAFPRVLSICQKRISKLLQFRSHFGLNRCNYGGVTETADAYFRRMAGTIAYRNTPHSVLPRVLSICQKKNL